MAEPHKHEHRRHRLTRPEEQAKTGTREGPPPPPEQSEKKPTSQPEPSNAPGLAGDVYGR
jgi:hypothetical protein